MTDASRRQFLRGMGYTVAGVALLRAPGAASALDLGSASAGIGRGYDFLTTTSAHHWVELSAAALGDGARPYAEVVEFRGAPLGRPTGDADTVVERLDDATPGTPVRTRLAGLSLVSSHPVELRGSVSGAYWLRATLSPTAPSRGTARYDADGRFVSELALVPLYELRPVAGGRSLFVDANVARLPHSPILLASAGRWERSTSPRDVAWTSGESLSYPGDVVATSSGRAVARHVRAQATTR